ncbi:MAG: LLM class F420-dependent oxidoreductase [Acidimicrobiia bacterium]
MRSEAVLGLWQDRAPDEALATARIAEDLGYRCLWIGEMATYDAFALATAVAESTGSIEPVVGPLAVTVRSPVNIAMGVASVVSLTGRPTHVALGTSSKVVVERWHGRRRAGGSDQLGAAARSIRTLLAGERDPDSGFRLRLPPTSATIHIAAFGARAIRAAATHADRMLLNMVTPAAVADFRRRLDAAGGGDVPLSAWLVTAVDPTPADIAQIRSAVVGYLSAPGYDEMFAAAGYGELVERARAGTHPRDLLESIPDGFERSVGLVGSKSQIEMLIADYRDAGLDSVCVVPVTASGDRGRNALAVVADLTDATGAD